MICFTFLFYLGSGVIAALALLYEPYSYEWKTESTIHIDYDFAMNIVIICLQIVKFILLCCLRRCVTFNTAVIWIGLEAVICLGLAITTLDG